MALLAEQIVEEWLNRNGYFTMRGVKLGVHEMDLLAVRPGNGGWECRHLEVQASANPVSYLTNVPKSVQRETGRAAGSAKQRTTAELQESVAGWIEKKYDLDSKKTLMQRLCPGAWSRELVIRKVKHEEEIEEIQRHGVTVHRLKDIVSEMLEGAARVEGARSGDVFELMTLLRD